MTKKIVIYKPPYSTVRQFDFFIHGISQSMTRSTKKCSSYLVKISILSWIMTIDPCGIGHVGRRNNTIYLLWKMASIVMQKVSWLLCLPTWHFVSRRGLLSVVKRRRPFVTCLIAARCRNSATYANCRHHNERILWHEIQYNYFHRRAVICSIRSTIDIRRSRTRTWAQLSWNPHMLGCLTN